MAEKGGDSRVTAPARPTITLPPRSSIENIFTGGVGASPGPMTLVSSFFSDNYPDSECRSFSQLLAGAMASPAAVSGGRASSFADSAIVEPSKGKENRDGGEVNLGFKQSRPLNLMVAPSPMFTVPPGLSPSGLLNSPGFFSPGTSPFGISHQQALAQVTAQAALSQSSMHIQTDFQSSSLSGPSESLTHSDTTHQQMPPLASNPKTSTPESSEISHSDTKPQLSSVMVVDKPVDDGYNWRKYGQKQVKGSEYPRSYYKCTHLNCPVKKKVERSHDGHVTEIIYKGQHNHELPQSNKRPKDSGDANGNINLPAKSEPGSQSQMGQLNGASKGLESIQPTATQLLKPNGHKEVGDAEVRLEEGDDDEPNPKRRNTEVVASEISQSHKTVTEPRIIVQTRSEVDLLDDGYRWRKYGQKVVKGNPHPRSYYKCTSIGCNVRKHVERASTDPKAVITTYEGKHNHDLPAARNSSHNTGNNNNSLQLKPQNTVSDFGSKDQRPVALLRLKEEQITV